MRSAMRMVAEREAEEGLPLLLDDVKRGEVIAILRGGHIIAELTPVAKDDTVSARTNYSPEDVRAAMRRIRERAKLAGMTFDWDEVKAWRDEGRA